MCMRKSRSHLLFILFVCRSQSKGAVWEHRQRGATNDPCWTPRKKWHMLQLAKILELQSRDTCPSTAEFRLLLITGSCSVCHTISFAWQQQSSVIFGFDCFLRLKFSCISQALEMLLNSQLIGTANTKYFHHSLCKVQNACYFVVDRVQLLFMSSLNVHTMGLLRGILKLLNVITQ